MLFWMRKMMVLIFLTCTLYLHKKVRDWKKKLKIERKRRISSKCMESLREKMKLQITNPTYKISNGVLALVNGRRWKRMKRRAELS